MNRIQKDVLIWENAHQPLDINSDCCVHSYARNMSIVSVTNEAEYPIRHYSHSHSYYEFCLPLVPIPFIIVDDVVYFGEVGWVFPFPSGTLHGIKYDVKDSMQYSIIVEKKYYEALMLEKGHRNGLSASPFRATEELKIYIEAFKKEFTKGAVRDNHKLRHLTALICDELIDESRLTVNDGERQKSGYQSGIHAAADFINGNYDKPVSLQEVAKMCGFSRNYFTTCFKQVLGKTPLEYLTMLRISKAKQLIETTSDNLDSIARKCGFTKLNTFTQAFRKATGVNPTEYRKQLVRTLLAD